MAKVLIHRGPDQDGFLERPGIGLASRRLSILDLKDGRQPMANEDQTVWVVFNGELFDHAERRADLESMGHRFATHCDTELLPHLWESYGEEMFTRMHGQFAFALWDEGQQQLVLARDRFGICPLFWTKVTTPNGTWLLFASEIKALLASGMVEARPDVRGINQLFTFLGVAGTVTCFQGVQTLHPGHFLTIRRGDIEQPATIQDRIYWQMDFPDAADHAGQEDPQRLADELESTLYRAVQRRLRADVPVVSYLSGGVDSSIVVAMASRILGQPIPTFTVRVLDSNLDESAGAAQTARHVGSSSFVIPYHARDIVNEYPRLIFAAETPVIDTSAAANLLLAQRVHAEGYKVALTGEGADEWLAGYPWFHAARVLTLLGRFPRLTDVAIRAHLRWLAAPRGSYALVQSAERAVGGHNIWLMWSTLIGLARRRFFSPAMQAELAGHEPFADLQLNVPRMIRWHPLHRGLCLGARTLLAGMLLSAKGDRVAMRSSVETRYPFLDEEVYLLLAGISPRWKLRGLVEKYLLRRVAERWLPPAVAWRRKAMFRAPLDPFHSPEAPVFFRQLLSSESLRRTGYFDADAVQVWQQRYADMRPGQARISVEMGLVGVVATQLWHHLFIDPTLADLPVPR